MLGVTLYYRTLYYDAEKARKIAVSDREKQQVAFEQLSHQMQTISVLDAQHTKELEHDKNLIAQLERDVADGRRRLQINAICPAVPTGSTATRMDDAARARFTDTAQRNYFTLRRRIEIAEQQINGLQDYIRQVVFAMGSPYQKIKETKK
ncbi:putative phage lysis protein, endopeptidase [Serratia symbiotica str. Tucson]|uniref:Phage lysis protein endopeptidase n=3 Tax=Serratia symbiotica TaxID=138074 RepID=A0A455VRH2_9GAMM|nr:putative phage lysis protein, endopeptidase [Serratia symbiotica str. Tucson]BBI91661.1 phage lysis protein endopeptidase [Serratia symbiotica]